jgi:hypothetical protein
MSSLEAAVCERMKRLSEVKSLKQRNRVLAAAGEMPGTPSQFQVSVY